MPASTRIALHLRKRGWPCAPASTPISAATLYLHLHTHTSTSPSTPSSFSPSAQAPSHLSDCIAIMHISFFPTLGSYTRVPVGDPTTSSKRDADGVRAAFTARLSHQDYAEVVKTGLRIEVWTSASGGARPAGTWGPIAFEELIELTDAQDAVDPESPLSIDTNEYSSPVDVWKVEEHVFRAALTLPRNPGAVFEFTYRLVYPSGICWLGSDRDNGVLELDTGSAFFEESHDAWDTRGDRRVLVSPVLGEHDVEQSPDTSGSAIVGALDMFEWTWTGWGTDGSRVWSLSNNYLEVIQEARLAILIPVPPGESFILPQIHVFRATSEEATFSLTSQGQVILNSSRSRKGAGIHYWLHDGNSADSSDALRDEILSSCSAPYVLPLTNPDMIIFTPTYDTDASVTIHAQSLTCSQSAHRSISFPISALGSFAKDSTVLSLFDPETRSTLFVDRSDNPVDVTLRLGASGARMVVSAVYDLADDSRKSSRWKLSLPEFTTEPKRITATDILSNPLPTPPASPQAKPIRTVSFVLPIETEETERGLRQRKPTESPTSTPQSSTRRLVRSESAFERVQCASGGEKIRVVIVNSFKLLTRFMGIAVLRFILFALRLVGRHPIPARVNSDGHNDAPSVTQGDSNAEEEAYGENVSSSETAGCGDALGTRPLHNWSTISTEPGESDLDHAHQQGRSIGLTGVLKSVSPALKWVLPRDGATPIRLLVRSDVVPENIHKHLCIQLNGEDVMTKGWGAVHGVGGNVSIIDIERPRDVPLPEADASVLRVMLRA